MQLYCWSIARRSPFCLPSVPLSVPQKLFLNHPASDWRLIPYLYSATSALFRETGLTTVQGGQ